MEKENRNEKGKGNVKSQPNMPDDNSQIPPT